MNVAAALGACVGPLIIGALTKANLHTSWRNFYARPPFPPHTSSYCILTPLEVDSNGTLGDSRNRPFLWLQASEEARPIRPFVILAECWE